MIKRSESGEKNEKNEKKMVSKVPFKFNFERPLQSGLGGFGSDHTLRGELAGLVHSLVRSFVYFYPSARSLYSSVVTLDRVNGPMDQ